MQCSAVQSLMLRQSLSSDGALVAARTLQLPGFGTRVAQLTSNQSSALQYDFRACVPSSGPGLCKAEAGLVCLNAR